MAVIYCVWLGSVQNTNHHHRRPETVQMTIYDGSSPGLKPGPERERKRNTLEVHGRDTKGNSAQYKITRAEKTLCPYWIYLTCSLSDHQSLPVHNHLHNLRLLLMLLLLPFLLSRLGSDGLRWRRQQPRPKTNKNETPTNWTRMEMETYFGPGKFRQSR